MNPGRYFHERRVVRPFLRGMVPVAVILLAVAGSVDSVGFEPATSTGVQVTKSVPFVQESIDEIRALTPFREGTVPENRAIHVHRIPRGSGATRQSGLPLAGPILAAPFLPSAPAPSAPVLDSSFAGLGNPPRSEGDVIPPDTMGAVGPNHLVSLLNSDFGVFNKSGTRLQKIPLQTFWASLGTAAGGPADFPFDTKVLYDISSGRFFAMTLGGTSSPNSWILVAVSATDNALGTWTKWAIDADRDNDSQLFNNWADFPGIGLDASNLYINANMFSNSDSFQYSKIWVLPKAQLLSAVDNSNLTWTEFRDPPGSDFNMQPAHTFGAAPAEYYLFEGSSTHLLMARIDNTAGTPVWHAPTAVPIASYPFLDRLPGAPQAGNDNTIDTGDPRLLNAVYRNGSLWTVHTVQSPATVKTEVAWYRINPDAGAVLAQGRISDPVRWYHYPSIGVNQNDVAAIGFSGSSSREYVGGYYTIIRPSSGIADPVSLLKTGEAPYYKTLGSGINRWGDYSATVVDPNDNVTFWTLQEYAQTPDNVAGGSRWGTWWGKFHPSDVAAPSGLWAAAGTGVQFTLTWTDSSVNELGFKVERRRAPAGGYSVVGTVGPNVTSFIDNAETGLAAGASYFYRVEAFNAGGGAYSNEAYVTTQNAPPAASGGGGGGGCLSIASPGETIDASSVVYLCFLLLPAAVSGWRRFARSGRKGIAPWLLLMALALPSGSAAAGEPGGIPEGPTLGVRVSREVPFASESFGEIRASGRNRIPQPSRHRTIPFLGTSDPFAPSRRGTEPGTVPGASAPLPQAPVALLAPALDSGFPGLENPPHAEGDVVPPNAMGAAGPAHLVTFLNSGFGVFSKEGAKLDNLSLQAFWGSLGTGPGEPAEFPFDTKVLYDPSSGRFIVISLGGGIAPDSWILLAVSSSSDPLAAWNKWAIDADLDNNIQQFNNFADYPGVGVDEFNVYVSTNMFSNARAWQYSKVWVLPKSQLLSATDNITWTEFRGPPGSSFSMQPAHTFGAAGEEYFLFEGPVDGLGMVSQLQLARMDNTSGSPVWHLPVAVPVTPYARSFDLPDAPQLRDSRGIYTADTRMQNVVRRNGSLWSAHHLAVNGKVEVAWYRINPAAGAMTNQGRISDPDRWYYFPSIGVNKDSVAAIGFSGSSSTEYAGAFYTIVRPASGAAEPVALLKAGEAPYFKTLGTGTPNRWGDFSSTVVDPSDDTTFWTLQEYAKTPDPVSGESRWGTWWGKFSPSAPSGGGGGGGGGGCHFIPRSGGEAPSRTSLFSIGILFLPAFALGLRRFSRRRRRIVPIRHSLC